MEFFARTTRKTDAATLQGRLTITALPDFCASVDEVLRDDGDSGRIYCVWGEFDVERVAINGGVRFILPHCPNAFSWTVTSGLPPDPDAIVVHATINRIEHDPDFIETLEDFVDDWRAGLDKAL